jgi:hypothetical protein
VHEWNNIPQAFTNDWLVLCVGRCEAVVAARGGYTRYWTSQTSIMQDNLCHHIMLYRVHLAMSGIRTHNFSDGSYLLDR